MTDMPTVATSLAIHAYTLIKSQQLSLEFIIKESFEEAISYTCCKRFVCSALISDVTHSTSSNRYDGIGLARHGLGELFPTV